MATSYNVRYKQHTLPPMMKLRKIAPALITLLQTSSAHYVFSRLIVNNTLSTDFQYIRDILGVSGTTLWSKSYPIYSPSDPDLICGRSTFPLRNPGIQTAVIRAGDDVSFMLSTPEIKGEPQGYIFHNGPGQVFLSRLPDGVRELGEYDGAGDWFKIAYQGTRNATAWLLTGEPYMNFTMPEATPPGRYLMRMEHFMPNWQREQSQFFVSCAHVEVVGEGKGVPMDFVRFPNAYKEDDPWIWFHDNATGYFPKDISVYQEPVPKLWTG